MSFDDELVQVLALLCREALQAEIVEYEKFRCEKAAERSVKRVVSTCLQEFFEQHIGTCEHHAVAGAHRCTAEALCEHRFSDADGPQRGWRALCGRGTPA